MPPENHSTQSQETETPPEGARPVNYYTQPEKVPYGPQRTRPEKQRSGLYLPLWSLVLMVLAVFGMAGGIVFLVVALGGPANLSGGEPRILIITAEPITASGSDQESLIEPTAPALSLQPASAVTLTGPTLVPTSTPSPTPQVIGVGATVVVTGAGGVNIRSGPGRSNSVVAVANPGQTFEIIGGPEEADGLTFWELQSTSSTTTGWAAESDGQDDLLEVYVP